MTKKFYADTSRPQRDYEDNGKCYWFVDRETMENDIRHHKYFEYGEHKGHIYGTTLDSIRDVINEGKMCVLDCSPAVSVPTQLTHEGCLYLHIFE